MKICNGCKIIKPLTDFGIRNYPNRQVTRSQCRNCEAEYAKKRRCEKFEEIKNYNRQYVSKNKEKVRQWNMKHFNQNKERVRERARNNYKKYREIPEKVIIQDCRSRINKLINNKNDNTINLIGCSPIFLRKWLEWQFDSKMNWKNKGSYWHIEHVKPCNSFDFNNKEEIYKCFNWKNIRPYDGSRNMSKGDKILPYEIVLQELKVYHYKSLKP